MGEKKVMRKISLLLRKCKSFSMQLGRSSSSSYSNLRSNSAREHQFKARDHHHHHHKVQQQEQEKLETIFVGSTRKRYSISSNYLIHPLLKALMEKKTLNQQIENKPGGDGDDHEEMILVKCEVVLFDHLLWLLDNADPNLTPESLEDLAEFYMS